MSMKKKRKRNLWFLCAGASDGRLPRAKVEALLISAGYDCKTPGAIQKSKEMIKVARVKYLKVDSGGFQIHSAEKRGASMTFDPEQPLRITRKYFNLAPRHVVEKAMEMRADSMVALDFPIRKIKDPDEREREFRKKLQYNVPWAIETAKLRKKLCPNIDLFIPVQAYDLDQFEVFYAKIKGIDFDGFSLPVRNMSLQEIGMFLLQMSKWGIRRVHILGSSSLPVISLCAYMSQRYFDWVSFDATSWRRSAQYGTFLQPDDLSSKKLHGTGPYNPYFKCHCASCKGRTLAQIAALKKREKMTVLVTHNYLAIQNLCGEFRYLRERLKGSKRPDIKRILRCMSEIETLCSMKIDQNS
jgi:tRNA-guanine family transglycosylase